MVAHETEWNRSIDPHESTVAFFAEPVDRGVWNIPVACGGQPDEDVVDTELTARRRCPSRSRTPESDMCLALVAISPGEAPAAIHSDTAV
jgi:hypothetical protein